MAILKETGILCCGMFTVREDVPRTSVGVLYDMIDSRVVESWTVR